MTERPYAWTYAIVPSRTTAIEALGAPLVSRTSAAALSIALLRSAGRVSCAIEPGAASSSDTIAMAVRRSVFIGPRSSSAQLEQLRRILLRHPIELRVRQSPRAQRGDERGEAIRRKCVAFLAQVR